MRHQLGGGGGAFFVVCTPLGAGGAFFLYTWHHVPYVDMHACKFLCKEVMKPIS